MRGVLALLLVFCIYVSAEPPQGEEEYSLTNQQFSELIKENNAFVMFYAPWCGHCKKLKPIWADLTKTYNLGDQGVVVSQVDCTRETKLCSDEGIRGYPSLMFYSKHDPGDGEKYSGPRTFESLDAFIKDQLEEADREAAEIEIDDGLYKLTEETFETAVSERDFFVKFYAPWCGHCKKMAPIWKKLAEQYENNELVSIAEVDCTKSNKICGEYEVRGYPTLLYLRKGKMLEKYDGGRELQKFVDYVTAKLEMVEDYGLTEGSVPDNEGAEPEPEEPVMILTETTFRQAIKRPKLTFVKFYAPWCGHCKRLAPTWDQLGDKFMKDASVSIGKIDCTQEKTICSQLEITGYPTLQLFRSGQMVAEFDGQRNLNELAKFITSYKAKDEL